MKAKHVFLTLGLSLTMGLGVAAAFAGAKGVKKAEASDPSYSFVYLTRPSDWGTFIKCYNYLDNDHKAAAWPGIDARKVQTDNGYGSQTWKAKVDLANYPFVIFNDAGSMQTADLNFGAGGDYDGKNGVYYDDGWKGFNFAATYSVIGKGSFTTGDFASDLDLTGNDSSAELTLRFEDGDKFKVRENHDWSLSYGYADLTNDSEPTLQDDGSGNILIPSGGTGYYKITLDSLTAYSGNGLKIEKLTTQPVSVYVDGVDTTEQLAIGALPDTPHYAYGKKFDGWYANADYSGEKVEGITNLTTALYGRIVDANNVAFVLNSNSIRDNNWFGSNRRLMLYAFNDCNEPNAAWPGTFINPLNTVGQVECYANIAENAKFILSSATKIDETTYTVHYQTIDIDLTGHTSESGLVVNPTPIADGDDAGKYTISWRSELDEPANAEANYYLMSTELGWDFAHSQKFTLYNGGAFVDDHNNIAVMSGYTAAAGEEIKVKRFTTGYEAHWINSAEGEEYLESISGFATIENVSAEGNLKITKAGSYDIYINDSDDSTARFYVGEHIQRETVNFYGVLYAGRQKLSEAGHPTLVASEQVEVPAGNYNPADPSYAGYSRTAGAFVNEDLSTPYEPAPLDAELDLYYRYDQYGVYLMGDATFTGSNATAWQIEGALISSAVSNPENVFEAVVTAPAGVTSSNPMSVKPYVLDGDPENVDWINNCVIGLDSYSSFARVHTEAGEGYGNIEITAPGTYAVYVKPEVRDEQNVFAVYFNEASTDVDTFVGNFLTEIGTICSELGGTKTLQDLKDKWGEMKTAYNALGGAEKAVIYAVGFSGGSETGDPLHQMVAKYARIVSKYGTANFEDFIWGQTISSNRVGNLINTDSMALIVTLVSVTTIVASAALVMFLLKKKKYSK